jgi:hypothetical protein
MVLLLLSAAGGAAANDEAPRPVRRWLAEVALGGRWGPGSTVADVRLFAAALWPLAPAPASGPILAVGAHFAAGAVNVDDPRGINGVVTDRRLAAGPEGRLIWAAGGDGRRGYGFLAVAPVWIAAPARSARLAEGGGAPGLRVAAGAGAPWLFYPYRERGPASCDGGTCGVALLLALLPTLIEVTYENVGGDHHRGGLSVGYSF